MTRDDHIVSAVLLAYAAIILLLGREKFDRVSLAEEMRDIAEGLGSLLPDQAAETEISDPVSSK